MAIDPDQLRQAREASILSQFADCKTLTPQQFAEVSHLLPPASESGKKGKHQPISIRQKLYVDHRMRGLSQEKAYRKAYNRPDAPRPFCIKRAWMVEHLPAVAEAIAALQKKSDAKTLLTLNDRLLICAEGAKTALSWNDRLRSIEVYTKLAGDAAPEKNELTLKNAPGESFSTVTKSSVEDRIAALTAARTKEAG